MSLISCQIYPQKVLTINKQLLTHVWPWKDDWVGTKWCLFYLEIFLHVVLSYFHLLSRKRERERLAVLLKLRSHNLLAYLYLYQWMVGWQGLNNGSECVRYCRHFVQWVLAYLSHMTLFINSLEKLHIIWNSKSSWFVIYLASFCFHLRTRVAFT